MSDKYICFKDWKVSSLDDVDLELKRGEEAELRANVIYCQDHPVAVVNSWEGRKHFANNYDGEGLQRGDITYAIVYSPRRIINSLGHVYRFSEEEQNIIREKYSDYLRSDHIDVILFGDKLFEERDIYKLRQFINEINIEIKNANEWEE